MTRTAVFLWPRTRAIRKSAHNWNAFLPGKFLPHVHYPGSAVLRFVVRRTLDCLPITEKDIAFALFPADNYAPGSVAVRVNASYMRKLLKNPTTITSVTAIL